MRFLNDSISFIPFTYTTSSAGTNNLAVNSTVLYITPNSNNDALTGIIGLNQDGSTIFIKNTHASNTLIISYNSSSSTSGNRFINTSGNDIYIDPGKFVIGIYGNSAFTIYELKETVYTSVSRSSTFSIPNNTLTTIDWNSTIENKGIIHSDTVNPSRLILPSKGTYRLSILIDYTTWSGNSQLLINVLKNGSLYKTIQDCKIEVALTPSISTNINLIGWTTNDYAEIQVLQNTGAARLISTDSTFFIQKL